MSPASEFLDRLQPPDLKAFFDYWQRKRGSRLAPGRGDIDPSEMRRFLPQIYMFDVVEPGPRFRFRLIGTSVASVIGDLTGQFIEETLSPEVLPRHIEHMVDVTETLAVRYMVGDLAWQDRPHIRFHRLLLPLSDDQLRANILLGIAHYLGVGEKRQGEAPGASVVPGPASSVTKIADARLAAGDIPPA